MTETTLKQINTESPPIEQIIAQELDVTSRQIWSAIKLLDGGATVPFIARYRKEATGGLSDIHLRMLAERLEYLRDMEHRRISILQSIEKAGKLNPQLKNAIESVKTKKELEDLYLPYKTTKRTKAQNAKDAGLEPLLDALLNNPLILPAEEAAQYMNPIKGVANIKEALDGAREILMERFYEDAELVKLLREKFWSEAWLTSKSTGIEEAAHSKYADYFAYKEPINKIPPHRVLALLRGRKEKKLSTSLITDGYAEHSGSTASDQEYIAMLMVRFGIQNANRPADPWLVESAQLGWRRKLRIRIDIDVMTDLAQAAELEAIKVFANNLRSLLLAAPAGPKAILALDPGYRNGVKIAAIDKTGHVTKTITLYPHEPQKEWDLAIEVLSLMIERYKIDIVAIGNGTGSRETDQLVGQVLKKLQNPAIQKIICSESGASIYSASEIASKEFPNLDVSLRGAVSIARRIQDPLAELVKIDPQSIGVGQYQHDVNQTKLNKTLANVVEDCVNSVGVNINTASAPLLSYVAGLNQKSAESLVAYRDSNGEFKDRTEIQKVPDMGPKTFEQAAGFLRIPNANNPLDNSGVHPEAYTVVNNILQRTKKDISMLMGNGDLLQSINPIDFVCDGFGVPTIEDILSELEKPGRDPRPEFRTAKLTDGIEDIKDLKPGVVLEGTVTNVTQFGAFVDIGVHQDGLVHVSEMANTFIKDATEYLHAGQIVRVKVLEIDKNRDRISLTMRQKSDADRKRENIKTLWK
ncbi:MAG: hypothetical protein ACI9CF_001620 [Candidatus Omnitrophota bacterium]|jgi:uncharacterized protein